MPEKASAAISAALAEWFAHHQRPLAFRQTRDPYAIMVSEFMLQQTTVATVQPYYARFMAKYPTVADLAAASEEDVMHMWAGLGYYRRARQLRAAAQAVCTQYGGVMPQTVSELISLPGFGRYTAGAVVSSAFDLPAPILEANTVRVFSRLSGTMGTVGETGFMNTLWSVAEQLVSVANSPRTFTLAAMELGALICKPKPRCEICPVQSHCAAYRMGVQEQTPLARPRREKIALQQVCVILEDAGRYLLRRIPAGQWHAGMWEFPAEQVKIGQDPEQAAQELAARLSDSPVPLQHFSIVKYVVTHHSITCNVFHCNGGVATHVLKDVGTETALLPLDEISKLPLGSAQKKIYMKLLAIENQQGLRL